MLTLTLEILVNKKIQKLKRESNLTYNKNLYAIKNQSIGIMVV